MNQRTPLFGMQLDAVRMPQAVALIYGWIHGGDACRYVVTPNVDHAVQFQEHAGLRAAYAQASLVLADGMPILLAARLLGRHLPERVPGSDLAPAMFDAAADAGGLTVYLLGAGRGVAEQAAARIEARWPAVRVAGVYSPPLGFERDPRQNQNIVARINAARPDLLLVGLGAPKQELWLHAHHRQLEVPAALAVGATIDFLAGAKARAPLWMRRVGLEWLHRLATEPGRLAKRYLWDAWIFPQLVWHEWRRPTANEVESEVNDLEPAELALAGDVTDETLAEAHV